MEAPYFRDFFGGNQSFLDKQGQGGNFDEQAGGKLGHGELQIRQRHLLNMQLLQNQQRADQLAHHHNHNHNHNHHIHHNHQHDHSIMQMQPPISTPMEVAGASYPPMPYYGNSMPVWETNSEFTPIGVGDHITPISLRNPSYESSGALNGFSVSHGFSNTFQPEHYQVANDLQAERLLSSLSRRHGQLPQPRMTNDYAVSRTSGVHTLLTASNLEKSGYHGLSKESSKSFSSSNTMQYEAMGGGSKQIAYKKPSITANMEQAAWPVYLNQDANNAQRTNFVHQTGVGIVSRDLETGKQQIFKYGSYGQDQLSRDSGQITDTGIVNAGSKGQSSCQNRNPGQSYQSSEKLAGLQACTPLYSNEKLGLTNAIDPNWQQLVESNGNNLKCSQQTQNELNEHRTHNKATARDGSHTHLSNSMEYESYDSANAKRQSYINMFNDLEEGKEEINLPQEIDAMSRQNAGGLQVKDGSLPLTIPQSLALTRSVTNAHFPRKFDTGSLYQPNQESRLNSIKAESKERRSREFLSAVSPSLPPQWQLHSTGDSFEPESSRGAGVRMLDAGFVDNPEETCRPFHSSLEKLNFPPYDGAAKFTPNADVNSVKSLRTCEFPAVQLPAPEIKGVPFRSSSNSLHSRGRIEGNETLEQANGSLSKPSAIFGSPNVSYVGKVPSTAGGSLASCLSPQSFGLRLAPPTPSQSLQHIVTRNVSDEMVFSQVRSSSRESAMGVNGGVAQVDMLERSRSYLRDSMAHSAPHARVGEGDNVAGFPFLVPRAQMQMAYPLLPSNYGQHRYPSAGYADLWMPSPSGFMVSPQSSSSQVNTGLLESQAVKAGLTQENSSAAYSAAPPVPSHGKMISHPTRTEHNPSDIQTRDNALFPMKAIQSDTSLVLRGDSKSSHSFGQANRVSQMSQRLLDMFSLNSKGEVYRGASRLGEKLSNTSQSICNQPAEMNLEASFNQGGEFPINSNSEMHMGNPGSPGKLFVSSTQSLSNQKKQVGLDGGGVQPVNSSPNVFKASFSAQIMSSPKVTPMSIPEFQQPKALFTPKSPSNGNTRGYAQNREDFSFKDSSMDQSSERLPHPNATSMEDEHVPFVSRPDSLRHMRLNEKAIGKSFDLRADSEEGMPRLATRADSRNVSKQMNRENILGFERASETPVSDKTGENIHKGLISVELTKSCEDQEVVNRFHDSIQSLPSGKKSGGNGELVVAGAELLVAPFGNNADTSGSHLQTDHNLVIPCRKKRKRMHLPYVPWHLAIKQPRGHLLSTRSLESKWAEVTNRLPEKDDGETEYYASNAHNVSRAVGRLKLTTLVMQQIVPLLPISLMQGSQGADYESITYTVAKICLEETCKLVSHAQMHAKDHQQTQFHAVSMIVEAHSNGYGPKEYPLTRLLRRFMENVKQLSSGLERLENAISASELRNEVQELDNLAIVNRLIKYQGGSFFSGSVHSCTKNSRELHSDSVRSTLFTERYVTAWPMPRILPENASCLSL